MLRLSKTNTVRIECAFTKDDWQIFDADLDHPASVVVDDLNFQLCTFVNAGYSKKDVWKLMCQDMSTYIGYGTCDTEPMAFLEEVLDEIYGEF